MSQLKIKGKIEDMIIWARSPLMNFPSVEKHVLSAKIRLSMYELLELTFDANRAKSKLGILERLDAKLDLLRSLVHISLEWKYLSFRQYKIWAEHLASIGRMLGKWILWAKKQEEGKTNKEKTRKTKEEERAKNIMPSSDLLAPEQISFI